MPDPAATTVATDDHETQMVKAAITANPSMIPPQFGGDPEKYLTAWQTTRASLTKAQQELAALKAGNQITPPTATATTTATTASASGGLESLKIPEAPQVTLAPKELIKQEILASGKVSEATRKILLEKHGLDSEIVDAFEQGTKAQIALNTQQAAEVVGGMDKLKVIVDWAAVNLSAAEKPSINAALNDPALRTAVLMGLQARMGSTSSNEPTTTPGVVTTTGVGGSAFSNPQEMMTAMRDPRYGKDEAYTQTVYQRTYLFKHNTKNQ